MRFTALSVATALAATPAAAQLSVAQPSAAPNVLLVLTNDVGFATTSTCGGAIPKPQLDRLAQRGLRFKAIERGPHRHPPVGPSARVCPAGFAGCRSPVGRSLDELVRQGQLDNTLIVFIAGDNGSSAEGGEHGLFNEGSAQNPLVGEDCKVALVQFKQLGGPVAYAHFPACWAHAMSTPFPCFKRAVPHLRATRNGMAGTWPRHTDPTRGHVRSQFHYLTGVFPTILEAAGITVPSCVAGVLQMSANGVSMLFALDSPRALSRGTHQFFEIPADAAICADG